MAKKSFAASVGGFIGRMISKVIIGILGATCRALVLGYPVSLLWNDLRERLGLQEEVSGIDFWTAFKAVLLIGFFCLEWFKDKNEKEED